MNETIREFFSPTSIFQFITTIIVIIVLVKLVSGGKLKSIGGEKGICFTGDDSMRDRLNAFMEHSDNADQAMVESLKIVNEGLAQELAERKVLHTKLDNVVEKVDANCDAIKALQLESIKTQILLDTTSHERKLYLFDRYKAAGGNGWMEEWIEDYKAGRSPQTNRRRTDTTQEKADV